MSEARVVGGTRRKDGTYRKEVKVRPGFKTEELDVEARAYVSKGVIREQQLKNYIPGANYKTKPEEKEKKAEEPSARALRRAAEREAKKKEEEEKLAKQKEAEAKKASEPVDPEKQLRKLNKLLKQMEKLEISTQAGQTLSPDEQAKLDKKPQVLAEIEQLSGSAK